MKVIRLQEAILSQESGECRIGDHMSSHGATNDRRQAPGIWPHHSWEQFRVRKSLNRQWVGMDFKNEGVTWYVIDVHVPTLSVGEALRVLDEMDDNIPATSMLFFFMDGNAGLGGEEDLVHVGSVTTTASEPGPRQTERRIMLALWLTRRSCCAVNTFERFSAGGAAAPDPTTFEPHGLARRVANGRREHRKQIDFGGSGTVWDGCNGLAPNFKMLDNPDDTVASDHNSVIFWIPFPSDPKHIPWKSQVQDVRTTMCNRGWSPPGKMKASFAAMFEFCDTKAWSVNEWTTDQQGAVAEVAWAQPKSSCKKRGSRKDYDEVPVLLEFARRREGETDPDIRQALSKDIFRRRIVVKRRRAAMLLANQASPRSVTTVSVEHSFSR